METNSQTLFLTSLTIKDLRTLFRSEIESYFSSHPVAATPPHPFTKKPINIDEASEFTGIPKNTIYAKIDFIPHIKQGRRLLFFKEDLIAYLESGRVKTRNEIEADVETPPG